MFWQCSKCLRWPIIIIIIIIVIIIIIILSFFKFSFFSNDFTTKMREKQMMTLMNCDRTLREKNEWEYQRNRNFVFGISSATILYSPLPMHPFLGNCEMAVAPVQKKKKNFKVFFFFFYYYFYFLKWNNGITRLFK